MSNFWNTSNNAPVIAQTSVDNDTDMPPIPKGTLLRSIVTEAKFEDTTDLQKQKGQGERFIKIRWDVIDGEYKKRVVFQKIWIDEEDASKRDKAIQMLAAIDANAGGKLMTLGREPTDGDMMMNLCNKPMIIRVAVWSMKDDNGDKMEGNWVNGVFDSAKAAPAAKQAAAPVTKAPDFDDDVPFG